MVLENGLYSRIPVFGPTYQLHTLSSSLSHYSQYFHLKTEMIMAPAWQGYFDDQVYTADLNLARFGSVSPQ